MMLNQVTARLQMSAIKNTAALAMLIWVCAVGDVGTVSAQTTKQAAGPVVSSRADRAAAPVSPSTPSEAAQKAEIMSSERWKRVEKEFAQWLSVQVIYTPAQVEAFKTKLKAEIQNMSASELQQFLDQWDAKLQILLGRDTAQAREWLGQYLSVIADGYRPTFLKKLGITDVSNLSASQIEDELNRLRAERLAFQQQRSAFNLAREEHVQMAEQFHNQQREILKQSGTGQAAEYGTFQSPMSPRQYNYQPLPPIVPFFW
jgi:hypothetical protein